jgi:hypothetical protein
MFYGMSVLQIYGLLLQIYGYAPTDSWLFATEIRRYPQPPWLVATNSWFKPFPAIPGEHHLSS